MADGLQILQRFVDRDDVGIIVAMLADDALGRARERLEDPLPESYFKAFEKVDRDPNIQLVVAQDGEASVITTCSGRTNKSTGADAAASIRDSRGTFIRAAPTAMTASEPSMLSSRPRNTLVSPTNEATNRSQGWR